MTVDRVRTRSPQRAFLAASALLFVSSAAGTVAWCQSMSAMGGMPMPGGWTMSMAWMRMPEQTWSGAAASFMGMWLVMMVAMMLPSLVPMLWRYRQAVDAWLRAGRDHRSPALASALVRQAARDERQDAVERARRGSAAQGRSPRASDRRTRARGARLEWLTIVAAAGYFFVWMLFGAAAFLLGVTLAELEMRHAALSRAVPASIGVVVLIAGLLQFSRWKQRALVCCRATTEDGVVRAATASPKTQASSAFSEGVRLGVDCARCCASLMTLLLVLGVMDLMVMTVITIAITAERLSPARYRMSHAIGIVTIAAGALMLARAAGVA